MPPVTPSATSLELDDLEIMTEEEEMSNEHLKFKVLPQARMHAYPSSAAVPLHLLADSAVDTPLLQQWTPGSAGGLVILNEFLAKGLRSFDRDRAKTDRNSTSRLSPHIHFGEVSVRRIYYLVKQVSNPPPSAHAVCVSCKLSPCSGLRYFFADC